VFDHFDEGLEGGLLDGDAPEGELAEFAIDPKGVGEVGTGEVAVETLVEFVEGRGGELFDAAVFLEEGDGGEGGASQRVGGADRAVGLGLEKLAVQENQFAVEVVEGPDTEVPFLEEPLEGSSVRVVPCGERGDQRELDEGVIDCDLGRVSFGCRGSCRGRWGSGRR